MGFMGEKTQLTVSQHWRKRSPKDQASIPLDPPHCADNNTTYMQYEKNTKYTQVSTTKSRLCTVKCTQCDKTQSCSTEPRVSGLNTHVCALALANYRHTLCCNLFWLRIAQVDAAGATQRQLQQITKWSHSVDVVEKLRCRRQLRPAL